ncbi:MAG: hypothetical protein FJW40_09240 [Acidobacteria bacterium]|nr:hypothetical protein [Acidobacteriota bacterium]
MWVETSYYLQPEEAGEKPYTLLFEAMRSSGYLAVAKLLMHNREHIVVLRPGKRGMILHTLYYRDEVREMDEFRTDTSNIREAEVKMALGLIEALAAPFDHEKYRDVFREQLRAMIQAKIDGQEVVAAPQSQEIAPVIDIMEALKQSLALLKKPPAAETEQTPELVLTPPAERARRPRRVAGG